MLSGGLLASLVLVFDEFKLILSKLSFAESAVAGVGLKGDEESGSLDSPVVGDERFLVIDMVIAVFEKLEDFILSLLSKVKAMLDWVLFATVHGLGLLGRLWHSAHPRRKRVTASLGRNA